MLKTIDFAGMRYTYDDTLFPNENTQIGELFVCFETTNPLRLVSRIYEHPNGNFSILSQLICEVDFVDEVAFGSTHWFKVIKVEPIPEIPVLKEGMIIYHIQFGEGKVVVIGKDSNIKCEFKNGLNSEMWYNTNGCPILRSNQQVLSFQPITLPKFEFKLKPKRVYIKDKINTDNLSDAMKHCKLIEHAILLIESGKELFYDCENLNPVSTSKINTADVFTSVVDKSRVYYYEY